MTRHRRHSLWVVSQFLLACAAVWMVLEVLNHRLAYVHAGSDLIYQLKSERLARARIFGGATPYRVVVMGNSRALSTFRPESFDAVFDGRTRSFNFGLPGDARFLPLLKKLLASGNRPTHVLLQEPWQTHDDPAVQVPWFKDDLWVVDTLLPFRKLPRDATLFAFQSLDGGFARQWDLAHAEVDGVVVHRGWYFIRAQSHYAHDALPADFTLPSDTPGQMSARDTRPLGSQYDELRELARTYGFRVLVIPHALRAHEVSDVADGGLQVLERAPYIATIGPLYWRLPNADFSDPIHTNQVGSEVYTRRLAALLGTTGEFR